ncbi:MAG: outer membrane protein assembly factor BamB [Oceanospirillaceae bacterium]|jgi:outer membrane protein assembly factor BamB
MVGFKRVLAVVSALLLLVGCSSDGEEIKPSALVKFDAEKKVKVLWSKSIGSNFGDKYHQLTPGVSGDSIVVTDVEGNVSSYELASGKLQWERALEVEISSGVGTGPSNTVVVATYSGDVIAISASTGEVNWQVAVGGEVVSRAQLNESLVVVQMVTGDVVALDIRTGEQRWVYASNQPNLTLRGTSSPLVALDATLAGLDNGKFVALDNDDGGILWQKRISIAKGKSDIERLTDIDGVPILYQNVIYIPSYRGNLTAINPFNAQVLWRKPYSTYRGLAAANNSIFLSADNDVVHGVDAESAAEIWRQDLLLNRSLTSPITLLGQVAVGDKQGYLHFLSQDDGRFVARYKLGGALVGDMLERNNVLYVLSNNGRLTALTIE